MVHLLPTVGYEEHPGMDEFINDAVDTAKELEKGGVHGILIENEFDHPHTISVNPEQEACILEATRAVQNAVAIPVGIDVLLNDWKASLNIAQSINCAFVRIDVFVDNVTCKYGDIKAEAKEIMEYKDQIGAKKVALFADIQVKHKEMLDKEKTLTQSATEALEAGADAIIVSGNLTGEETPLEYIQEVKNAHPEAQILIGAGITTENVISQFEKADGAFVGTSFKKRNGKITKEKVEELMNIIETL